MKRNIIYKGVAALTVAGLFASCNSDYLDVKPTTNITEDVAMNTPEGVTLAMNGIIKSMNKQYSNLDFNGNVGEAYIGTACNDAFGTDLVSGLWSYFTSLYNWSSMGNDRAYTNVIPWQYYYGIIAQCNKILTLTNTEDPSLTEADRKEIQFAQAQAYTMRAHSYQKLMGLYAPRYEDAKGGEAYCIVLRTKPGTEATPLVTFATVMKQIYDDLDEALRLYEVSGGQRVNKWDVDASVAHGVYARAALINHDWKTAQEQAAAARKGYTIMDGDTYLSGFTDDCSDYIWHMNPGYDTTYYWSWGAHYTCNGGYVSNWAMGAGAIDIDLYNATDKNDIRRQLYLMPDKLNVPFVKSLNSLQGKIKEKDFWNAKMVNENEFLNLAMTNVYRRGDSTAPGMYNIACYYSYYYWTQVFKGDISRFKADDNFYDYIYIESTSSDAKKSCLVKANTYARCVKIPFGAQYKFVGEFPYGNMAYPWMRASEMCLVEAEAYCMMNDDVNARKALTELMSKRVKGFKTTNSGADLLEEVRVARRMELFMEGQSFTDAKRWNIPVERRAWKDGDPKSGNVAPGSAMSKVPSDNKGWVFAIPFTETEYNDLVDIKLLNN